MSFALNMMLTSDHGSAHAKTEMARWLDDTGFVQIARETCRRPIRTRSSSASSRELSVRRSWPPRPPAPLVRPPGWLIAATALLALGVLAMAVAETNLWMHYLIDAGEPISLVGLAVHRGRGGVSCSRDGQLLASLPLMRSRGCCFR